MRAKPNQFEHLYVELTNVRAENRKILAAVRSAFGLTQYSDRVVDSGPTQITDSRTLAVTVRPSYPRRVDGLDELKADLLDAADAVRASDALARLTGVKPGHVKLDGAKIVKAVQDAQKRGAVPKSPNQAT